jgi:hypothetical protein
VNQDLESQARRADQIGEELEKAAAHARTAAGHFRSGEVPRGCAHSVAVQGHLIAAEELLGLIARLHCLKARTD